MDQKELQAKYGYCITPKHIAVAADRFGGMLGKEAVREAERQGAYCGTTFKGGGRCQLAYDKHEQALLVECGLDFQTDEAAKEELQGYLLGAKEKAEADGFAGFAFVRKEG